MAQNQLIQFRAKLIQYVYGSRNNHTRWFAKISLQLLEDLKGLIQNQTHTNKEWLRSAEVRRLLNIFHATLQNLRINGTLPFRKLGSIIFYKYDDIVRLLEPETHWKCNTLIPILWLGNRNNWSKVMARLCYLVYKVRHYLTQGQ